MSSTVGFYSDLASSGGVLALPLKLEVLETTAPSVPVLLRNAGGKVGASVSSRHHGNSFLSLTHSIEGE
uniref:Uncharacterized protein n=1 Tax=Knipowitschia caucasica TaxID=637954 RepID=A0AAV2M7R8_KNICA